MKNTHTIVAILAHFFFAAFAVESLAVVRPADSSRGVVSGFVEDIISKEPLIGATISIKGIKAGAYTNKSGYFSISNLPAGLQTVVVSYIGYLKKEVSVSIPGGSGVKVRVALRADTVRGRELTVTANRDEDKREISISRVNIPIEQLSQLRIGGEADIFRALQMLPGVLTSSQISSGLFIRGGSPDQNLVLLDGMTVYNPTHLFGFISA